MREDRLIFTRDGRSQFGEALLNVRRGSRAVVMLVGAATVLVSTAARGELTPTLRITKVLLAQTDAGAGVRDSPEPAKPASVSPAEFGTRKSYAIPALEILGFDLLLNRFNKQFSGSRDYDVDESSIRRNLRSCRGTDSDPYQVNQFAHPYRVSMYHGFARSSPAQRYCGSTLPGFVLTKP